MASIEEQQFQWVSTARALGINVENPCDPSQIWDELSKISRELAKEVETTINNLSWKMGGDFFLTSGLMLAVMLGGYAEAWAEAIVGQSLASIAGGIIGVLTLGLAGFAGAEILLQYFAVSALKSDLQKRIVLGEILRNDLVNILNFINAISSLLAQGDQDLIRELSLALLHVQTAKQAIGLELGKSINSGSLDNSVESLSGENPISPKNMRTAITEIDLAIENLSHDKPIISRVYSILTKHRLSSTPPITPFMNDWTKFFEDISHELDKLHFSDEERLNFLRDFSPIIPQIFQLAMMQQGIRKPSNRLIDRLPLSAAKLFKLKKSIEDKFYISDNFIKNFYRGYSSKTDPDPKILQEDKDLTYNGESLAISLEEAALLLFPSYWKTILTSGSMLKILLIPSYNLLEEVEEGIKKDIDDLPSKAQLALDKIEWIGQLGLAKSIISSFTGQTFLFGDKKVDPQEVASAFMHAGLILDDLKKYITDKTIDAEGNTKKSHASTSYDLAQVYLSVLWAPGAIALIASPKTFIPGARAVQVNLEQQLIEDRIEIAKCNSFISACESVPMFNELKESFEKWLKMGSAGALAGNIKNIMRGDIGKIAAILDDGILLGCTVAGGSTLYEKISNLFGSGASELESFYKEMSTSLTHLLNKKEKINSSTEIIQQYA